MPRKPTIKSSQRFVMYIPNELRKEIETWVSRRGITLAEFGRCAFETYLNDKRKEEQKQQLAETCRLIRDFDEVRYSDWEASQSEMWPS